jgi:hypothetical protein
MIDLPQHQNHSGHQRPTQAGALMRFHNPVVDELGNRSQNDFPNLFADSGKVVVEWFEIELNCLANIL